MLAKQRYNKILELLDKDGIVHTAELVKLMGVSSETVRKDLEYLDNQGRLSRVHGGAVPVDNGTTPDMPGGYISCRYVIPSTWSRNQPSRQRRHPWWRRDRSLHWIMEAPAR